MFVAQFNAWLDVLYRDVLVKAWDEGYDAGWSYGAFVREEWQYRLGYAHGYARGVSVGAEGGFDEAYEAEYERWYEEAFNDWSSHPKLALETYELVGASDIRLEPGDALSLRFTVVNYGGVDGTAPLSLAGRVLEQAVVRDVTVPRRSRLDPGPLAATLDPAAPGGAHQIEIGLGALSRTQDLMVHAPDTR